RVLWLGRPGDAPGGSLSRHARATRPIVPQEVRMRSFLVAAIALLLVSCQPQDESVRVARGFADEHYVKIDLAEAKKLTTGLATKKIEEEQHLVEGNAIDEGTAKPHVSYKLLETRPEGDDRVTVLFQGEARGDDAGEVFTRKWLITVKREDGEWKVSNFH